MAKDENPIKICWYCKRKFDGNFAIKDLQIICPYCKRPQSSVFEKDSQLEIIKRSKDEIKKSKTDFKNSEFQKNNIKTVKKQTNNKETNISESKFDFILTSENEIREHNVYEKNQDKQLFALMDEMLE